MEIMSRLTYSNIRIPSYNLRFSNKIYVFELTKMDYSFDKKVQIYKIEQGN